MSFSTPIHTNEQSVDRVLSAGLPVLLVFWRAACRPCAQLAPVLDRIAQAYAGKLLVAKIDADDNPALSRRYNVTQLPALTLVRNEGVAAQAAGAVPEAQLRGWIDAVLGGAAPPAMHGPTAPLNDDTRPQAGPAPQPASNQRAAGGTTQPIALTDATFDQVVGQSPLPVLVDFWAPWCGPCRMVAPAVEQLAREYAGRAVVAKLNVDDHQRIAQRYGIASIPALYIFKRGQVVERLVGAQPATALRQALQRHIA